MPTPPRPFHPSGIYHVYNRSSQKMLLFREQKDYERFMFRAREYAIKCSVEVLSYCLMPNHFHFLIREPEPKSNQTEYNKDDYLKIANISKFFHLVTTAYAKYFCAKYKFIGSVFGQPFRAKQVVDDSYLQTIIAYIHDNPVRAKLVKNPENWTYSSYRSLIGIDDDDLVLHDKKLSDLNHTRIWEIFARDRNKSITNLSGTLFRT
jgi:putative transposase